MMAMINEQDIELMHEWRDEVVAHRERPVTVIYVDKAYDPITGVPIGETEQTREVTAVVTEISSNSDRNMVDGIIYEKGDIKVDVKIELIEDIADKITQMGYADEDYEIVAKPRKGIGRRNRYELHGRVIT